MKCSECKGSGKYLPLVGPEEYCQTCGGSGSTSCSKPVSEELDMDPFPEWMEDYKDQIDFTETSSQLKVGDIVHVYDGWWYTAKVKHLNSQARQLKHYAFCEYVGSAAHAVGSAALPIKHICFNLTANRWEYIRSGTPTFP